MRLVGEPLMMAGHVSIPRRVRCNKKAKKPQTSYEQLVEIMAKHDRELAKQEKKTRA